MSWGDLDKGEWPSNKLLVVSQHEIVRTNLHSGDVGGLWRRRVGTRVSMVTAHTVPTVYLYVPTSRTRCRHGLLTTYQVQHVDVVVREDPHNLLIAHGDGGRLETEEERRELENS